MSKIIRLTALLSATVFLCGCAIAWVGVGAGLGVGTYRYIQGSVERDYSIDYNSAWDVVNTALTNGNISVISSMNEGFKGKIEAVQKDGDRVTITLKYLKEDVTTINVRVGFFGDREDAETIHEEIGANARMLK